MGFFKHVRGILGFGRDDAHHAKDQEEEEKADNNEDYSANDLPHTNRPNAPHIPAGPRRGFSVPVQVTVERSNVGPVVVPCNGDGGVQGLRWYGKRLRVDDDGDVADEFIYEVIPDTTAIPRGEEDHPSYASTPTKQSMPRFQVTSSPRRAKIKNQVMNNDRVLHHVEIQGRLQWV